MANDNNSKVRVNISLSPWILEDLDKMAVYRGMSRSAMISAMIQADYYEMCKDDYEDFPPLETWQGAIYE